MGLNKRSFLAGFFACGLLVACGASFPFKYYNYDIAHKTLQGDTPEHDLPDSVCDANAQSKYPCTCMMTPDAYALKADNLKCHTDLQSCQHGGPPN